MNVESSYSELGLAPDCSDAEVKAAWRRLAARWHPDRNASPQALRKIQRINRALEEIRRSRSAESGEAEVEPDPEPGEEQAIVLTLEQAAAGCTRELQGELAESCAGCSGTGVEPEPSTCRACAGSGRVRQAAWFAWLAPLVECGACAGAGTARQCCPSCGGKGTAPPRKYRCQVEVPPRAWPGQLLDVVARVPGRDRLHKVKLRVRVELAPHALFALEADGTVTCEVPVDGFAWTANRWIEVPTPGGLQQMRLRRGFFTYRIKGEGLASEESEAPADCMITVVPLFPEDFSREQEAAIDRLIASNARAGDGAVAAWNRKVAAWQAGLG